jgi:hypothetical protein
LRERTWGTAIQSATPSNAASSGKLHPEKRLMPSVPCPTESALIKVPKNGRKPDSEWRKVLTRRQSLAIGGGICAST